METNLIRAFRNLMAYEENMSSIINSALALSGVGDQAGGGGEIESLNSPDK